jgi:NhaP-type Na+/H+ or K+/H+ antiporter
MNLSSGQIIILLSIIIIISYLIDIISKKMSVPSVILLIGLGILLKYTSASSNLIFLIPEQTLELIGTIGLILIVLEASLDLKLSRSELPLMKKALIAASLILLVSSFSFAFLIQFALDTSFKKALITSIPLAMVSSSIAIPSVSAMPKHIKDFIIYEATFSDVIGILFFNYAIQTDPLTIHSISNSGINLILILLISIVCSAILIFLINKLTHHVKFFLILSMLVLTYSFGKIFHLPSLLLILIFGILINNTDKLPVSKISGYFVSDKLKEDLVTFKIFTGEIAFVIRTFFFVLFGYSIGLKEIANWEMLTIAASIIILSLLIRYIFLGITVKRSLQLTKLFLAPRGLITVLLFYSIPEEYIIDKFSTDIVFIVILSSSLLMMISFWIYKKESDIEELNKI